MRKTAALLVGVLSLLFAEVLSGSAPTWFLNPISIILLLLVYPGQLLFFFWISEKFQRTSLTGFYFLGVLFGLYESWITKVLWDGYQAADGPSMGTFMGLGIAEFPMLVFFWHPLMSFMAPLLVYQSLGGKAISTHLHIYEKTGKKSILLALFGTATTLFLAANAHFDLFTVNLALFGTLGILTLLFLKCKKFDFLDLALSNKGFAAISLLIVLLYGLSYLFISPERLPNELLPYLSVLFFYAQGIVLFLKVPKTALDLKELPKNSYSPKDAASFSLLLVISANLWCLLPGMAFPIMVLSYVLFSIFGVAIFLFSSYKILVR